MELTRLSDYICTIAKNGQRLYFYRGRRISKRDIPEDFLDQIECVTVSDRKSKSQSRERERDPGPIEPQVLPDVEILPSGVPLDPLIQPNLLTDAPRDVLIELTFQLEDADLYRLCQTNRRVRDLCRDERFWRDRYRRLIDRNVNLSEYYTTWKEAYQKERLITRVMKSVYNKYLLGKEATKYGLKRLMDELVANYGEAYFYYLPSAAKYRNWEMMNFLIERAKETDEEIPKYIWNEVLTEAVKSGDREFIEFAIERGGRDFNSGLSSAAEAGNRELVDYFIKKGAKKWYPAFYAAIRSCNLDLVKLFFDKMFQKIKLLPKTVSSRINLGITRAIDNKCNIEILGYLFEKANQLKIPIRYTDHLATSMWHKNLDAVDFIIQNGATEYNILNALRSLQRDKETVKYVTEKYLKEKTKSRSQSKSKGKEKEKQKRKGKSKSKSRDSE